MDWQPVGTRDRRRDWRAWTGAADALAARRPAPGSPVARRHAASGSGCRRGRAGDCAAGIAAHHAARSEEHTSELQSLMRISYAVFCLKKKKTHKHYTLTAINTN